jgi:hypothetical protein
MSAGKRVSATDMLSRGRRGASQQESTTPPVDKSTSRHIDQSTTTPVNASGTAAATSSSLSDQAARATYAKVAVSLTPEQRRWLKTTPAALDVEGLSSSDLVRLALTRLRADIDDGLPLTDLLIEQAHTEAQELTGRRNRGLPSR